MLFRRRQRRPSDLDDLIGYWSKLDPITKRMLCQNILILGKTGGGKSSGPGDFLLRCILRHGNTGGLFLSAKPDDLAYLLRVAREEGREGDIIVVQPDGPNCMNILDYEMKHGAGTRDLTQILLILGETLDRMEGGGSQGGQAFFKAKNREGLDYAIEIVTRAQGELDPLALQIFITGAAISPEELKDEKWQEGFHNKALLRAAENCTTKRQIHDCEAATRHWKETWARMNDCTKTSIEGGLLSPLHCFNTGIIREMLACEPENANVIPDLMEQRKFIAVHAPGPPGDANAVFINAAAKLTFQRYILRREPKEGDPLLCIWSDEFQAYANSYDRAYVERCRSARACLVALTQSTHALYARLYGNSGEHEADSLLTNFGHIVCTTLGDSKTAKAMSETQGQRRELFISPTLQPNHQDEYSAVVWGQTNLSVAASETYQPTLQPAAFLRNLRSGGPPDYVVDAVVLRTGQPFNASGENYLITSFKQR